MLGFGNVGSVFDDVCGMFVVWCVGSVLGEVKLFWLGLNRLGVRFWVNVGVFLRVVSVRYGKVVCRICVCLFWLVFGDDFMMEYFNEIKYFDDCFC